MKNKLISVIILTVYIMVLICGGITAAATEVEAKPDELELLNLNSDSFPSGNKGYEVSTEHTKPGYGYSLYWNHDTMTAANGNCRMELYSMPQDWTEFDFIGLSMYASKVAKVKFVAVCGNGTDSNYNITLDIKEGQNDFLFKLSELAARDSNSDYRYMKHIWLSASGWSMTPTEGGEFWLNSLKLLNRVEILDLDNQDSFSSKDKGYSFSTENTLDGSGYSIYWNHNSSGRLEFYSVPKNWAKCSVIDFSVYGKNCSGTKFVMVANCGEAYYYYTISLSGGQNDFSIPLSKFKGNSLADGWENIQYIWLSANGWGMTPTADSELWINSFKIRKQSDELEEFYTLNDIQKTYSALENGVAIYANSQNVVKGSEVYSYIGTQYVNEAVTAPLSLFTDYLGAELGADKQSVVANGITLSVSVGSSSYIAGDKAGEFTTAVYESGGELYVPALETAKALGFEAFCEKKLVVIGDSNIYDILGETKAEPSLEIAGYLAYHTEINADDITDDDMKEIKDRWRRELVGDETIDYTDSAYQTLLKQIYSNGNSEWATAKKNLAAGRTDSLFLEKTLTNSAQMSNEYNHIRSMALAYAQRGQSLYQNEELASTILECLEWMYENRYGEDEILNNENAWRDHNLTNWYDWQIATPQYLVDILMLMEDCLSEEHMEKYLGMFQHWIYEHCFDSMFSDAGMNVLYTAQNWIGSALLRNDAEEAIKAVSTLHNCFSWADNFSTGEGFYTDGSYVFHYKHPMTGQYGISQFEKSGKILSILKNSKLDFKNPRRENIFDWIFDAFEPVIYDGAMLRFVKGRAVTSGDHYVGRQFVIGLLDLVEFADNETQDRIKSLIKYIVQLEKEQGTVSYNDKSFTIMQLKKLNDILSDDNVQPRAEYHISKVYPNMDKTVHQRGDWAFGISMSSSRIYDYECIQGSNTTGWYTSDGMTQLMLKDDNYHFHSDYWDNIDPYKYPGTTVDIQERVAHTINTGNAFVKDFDDVGGTSLKNEYSVSAQHLNAFHLDEDITQSDGAVISAHNSSLTARKAWFCFDNEVVCVGSDIDANDGFEVRTIVENRKAPETVIADGETLELSNENQDISDTKWVHLENTAGYYFPDGGDIITRKTDSDTSFFELWLSHGISPENGGYSYVILPAATAEETDTYAENPDTYILCNTEKIQAVADKSTGTLGIVFWEAGSFGGVTVTEPMVLMIREKGGVFELSVSDTTQKLYGAEISFEKPLKSIIKANERMTLSSDKKTLNIDFLNSDGASIEGDFETDSAEEKISVESFGFSDTLLSANVKNSGAEFFELSLVLANYDSENRLIKAKQENLVLPPYAQKAAQIPSENKTGQKGFLWNGLNPLYSAVLK